MRKPFAKRTGSAIAGAIRSGAARTAASLNGESCRWLEDRSLKRRGPDHRPPSGLGKFRHSVQPKPLLQRDRKRVVQGKGGSVRVDLGGCRIIKKKKSREKKTIQQ